MATSYPGHARLLSEFETIFTDGPYKHRNQTLGNRVAVRLFDDLLAIERSAAYAARLAVGRCGLNKDVRVVGRGDRRGDGAFGEFVPGVEPSAVPGSAVGRGPVAAVEIGAEAKILAKAMNKQVDRVIGDLTRQVAEFRAAGGQAICIGVVGVNHAAHYTSLEGDRAFPTTGSGSYRHPIQEAAVAEAKLLARAAPGFDEFVVLRFRATNEPPYAFEWVDYAETLQHYGAALARVARRYEERFH